MIGPAELFMYHMLDASQGTPVTVVDPNNGFAADRVSTKLELSCLVGVSWKVRQLDREMPDFAIVSRTWSLDSGNSGS